MNTEATTELEELQDQARATVQLAQSERLTMQGHLRDKLRMGRNRLAKTWGQDGAEGEVDDDMQILARDITFNEPSKVSESEKVVEKVETSSAPATSKWPLAAALAFGLGIPGTTAIFMAPTIIDSLQGDQPVVNSPPGTPDYAPILLPGKPAGAK